MKRFQSLMLAVTLVLVSACGGEVTTDETTADLSSSPIEQPQGPERVIARVNGEPIEARQIDEVLAVERRRLAPQGVTLTPEQEQEVRRAALEMIIGGELVYQAARERGYEVTAERVEQEIDLVRSKFPSNEEFEKYIADAGSDLEGMRSTVERGLLMSAYTAVIAPVSEVGEAEAREAYDRDPASFMEPEQIRIEWIYVRSTPADSEEQREAARGKIDEADRRARAGEDFGALAAELSETRSASDRGFLRRGMMPPAFDHVAFATPVGEISDVFDTVQGHHMVKVLERREARLHGFDEVKDALIEQIALAERERKLQAHVLELREAATIEMLEPGAG